LFSLNREFAIIFGSKNEAEKLLHQFSILLNHHLSPKTLFSAVGPITSENPKTAANIKPVDTEDLMNKVSDLTDTANELNSTLGDLGVGVNNIAVPQTLQQPQQPQNNFQMPSSFNIQQNQTGPNNQGGPNQNFNNQGGANQGQQMAPGTF